MRSHHAGKDGNKCLVDVYALMSGKRSEKPSVVAELMDRNGHWLFTNFRYPGDDDLIATLRVLKANRENQQN